MGGRSPRKAQDTFRSSQMSLGETKLEGELIREAIDSLNKAMSVGGSMNSKALDSLYEILT